MTDERIWYVLQHRPGPAIEEGTSAFEHPGIRDHYAFLQNLAEVGDLVAAGPLLDEDGAGLTIIEADSEDDARLIATEDDESVVNGVLTVTVRPWRVVMARD
jgi:uncharacterized protein YciI